jgi:hypothetical protein
MAGGRRCPVEYVHQPMPSFSMAGSFSGKPWKLFFWRRIVSPTCRLEVTVADWFPNSQHVIEIILDFMIIVLVISVLGKVRGIGKEFARLQRNVERLSEEVKHLQVAEQRRFIKELNAPPTTINGPQLPAANSPSSES